MKVETTAQDKFASVTIQVSTPDGNMFVTILHDDLDKACAVNIHLGKAGAPIQAWSNALSRVMSLALDHGATINDLIEELSSQTSDRRREKLNGEVVRSGVEGVWSALMMYKRDKYGEMAKAIEGGADERGRGPRMGR